MKNNKKQLLVVISGLFLTMFTMFGSYDMCKKIQKVANDELKQYFCVSNEEWNSIQELIRKEIATAEITKFQEERPKMDYKGNPVMEHIDRILEKHGVDLRNCAIHIVPSHREHNYGDEGINFWTDINNKPHISLNMRDVINRYQSGTLEQELFAAIKSFLHEQHYSAIYRTQWHVCEQKPDVFSQPENDSLKDVKKSLRKIDHGIVKAVKTGDWQKLEDCLKQRQVILERYGFEMLYIFYKPSEARDRWSRIQNACTIFMLNDAIRKGDLTLFHPGQLE